MKTKGPLLKRTAALAAVLLFLAAGAGCKISPGLKTSGIDAAVLNDIPVPPNFKSEGMESHVVAVTVAGKRRFNTTLNYYGKMSLSKVKGFYLNTMPTLKWQFKSETSLKNKIVLIFENKLETTIVTAEYVKNITYINIRIDARE